MVQNDTILLFQQEWKLPPDTSNNFLNFLASRNFIVLKRTDNLTHNVLTCMYKK
jgi:hypothetical protein